jgi:hypothetical protein
MPSLKQYTTELGSSVSWFTCLPAFNAKQKNHSPEQAFETLLTADS